MTPRRSPLSEKEKAYAFGCLFPILWPLVIAMALVDVITWIKNGFLNLWRRLKK